MNGVSLSLIHAIHAQFFHESLCSNSIIIIIVLFIDGAIQPKHEAFMLWRNCIKIDL